MAVSLRLFTSRAAELQPRLRPFLHELPAALTAAAAAVDALADVHQPAAVAAAAAAAAHQKATETQVTDGAGFCPTLQRNVSQCTCLLQLPGT